MKAHSKDDEVGWTHLTLKVKPSEIVREDAELHKNKWTMLPGTSVLCTYQAALNFLYGNDSDQDQPQVSETPKNPVRTVTKQMSPQVPSTAKLIPNVLTLSRPGGTTAVVPKAPSLLIRQPSKSKLDTVIIQQGAPPVPVKVMTKPTNTRGPMTLRTLSQEQRIKIHIREQSKLQQKISDEKTHEAGKSQGEGTENDDEYDDEGLIDTGQEDSSQMSDKSQPVNVREKLNERNAGHENQIVEKNKDGEAAEKTRGLNQRVLRHKKGYSPYTQSRSVLKKKTVAVKEEAEEIHQDPKTPKSDPNWSKEGPVEISSKTGKPLKRSFMGKSRTEYLEKMFEIHHHFPRRQDIIDMAETLGVTVEKVRHWFVNRRQKFRKEHEIEWSEMKQEYEFMAKYRERKRGSGSRERRGQEHDDDIAENSEDEAEKYISKQKSVSVKRKQSLSGLESLKGKPPDVQVFERNKDKLNQTKSQLEDLESGKKAVESNTLSEDSLHGNKGDAVAKTAGVINTRRSTRRLWAGVSESDKEDLTHRTRRKSAADKMEEDELCKEENIKLSPRRRSILKKTDLGEGNEEQVMSRTRRRSGAGKLDKDEVSPQTRGRSGSLKSDAEEDDKEEGTPRTRKTSETNRPRAIEDTEEETATIIGKTSMEDESRMSVGDQEEDPSFSGKRSIDGEPHTSVDDGGETPSLTGMRMGEADPGMRMGEDDPGMDEEEGTLRKRNTGCEKDMGSPSKRKSMTDSSSPGERDEGVMAPKKSMVHKSEMSPKQGSPRSKKRSGMDKSDSGEADDDSTPRKKRFRTNFNEEQVEYMEGLFQSGTHFPDSYERERIASDLGLTLRTIITWFQNRRQKYRKDGHDLVFPGRKQKEEKKKSVKEAISEKESEQNILKVPSDRYQDRKNTEYQSSNDKSQDQQNTPNEKGESNEKKESEEEEGEEESEESSSEEEDGEEEEEEQEEEQEGSADDNMSEPTHDSTHVS